MKKALAIIFAMVFIVSICSCGEQTSKASEETTVATTQATTTAPAAIPITSTTVKPTTTSPIVTTTVKPTTTVQLTTTVQPTTQFYAESNSEFELFMLAFDYIYWNRDTTGFDYRNIDNVVIHPEWHNFSTQDLNDFKRIFKDKYNIKVDIMSEEEAEEQGLYVKRDPLNPDKEYGYLNCRGFNLIITGGEKEYSLFFDFPSMEATSLFPRVTIKKQDGKYIVSEVNTAIS